MSRAVVVASVTAICVIFIALSLTGPSRIPVFLSLFKTGPVGSATSSRVTKKTDINGNLMASNAMHNTILSEHIAKMKSAPSAAGTGSATSGSLFKGNRFRKFKKAQLKFTDELIESNMRFNESVEKTLDNVKDHMDELYCNHWAVVTTIFEPSDAVKKQSKVPGWCLVVVGDRKGPQGYDIDGSSGFTNHAKGNASEEEDAKSRPNFIFLGPSDQEDLADHLPIIKYLPWNHFGRKNVGYLYAILHGAQVIWDFDDDNGLIADAASATMDFEGFRFEVIDQGQNKSSRKLQVTSERELHLVRHKQAFLDIKAKEETRRGRQLLQGASRKLHKVVDSHRLQSTCKVRQMPPPPNSAENVSAFNPYPLMGAPSSPVWPRGFPLTLIKDDKVSTAAPEISSLPSSQVAVVQSLANHDPDIDAIYRLTMPLPFDFPNAPAATQKTEDYYPIAAPDNLYAPYNAQATLHLYSSLWSLLLPITVHGRVSDIWRGYFMQKVCKAIGLKVLFAPPIVKQDRNDHSYLADFQSELPLYLRTPKLLDQLSAFDFKSTENEYPAAAKSLPGMIEHLWVEMYERGYIEMKDVRLVQAWLESLLLVGYKFPDASVV